MKRKGLLALLSVFVLAICLSFAVYTVSAESVNGWANAANGKSTFTDNGGDTVITFAGNTSYGSSLALNESLAEDICGEYDLTFDLDLNLANGKEVWVSIIGIYKAADENGENGICSRTGLHFINNDWMNIAVYGNFAAVDKGFAVVVNKDEKFPAVTEKIAVKLSYRYAENGHTVQYLYLNGTLVLTADITEIYGYNYIDTEAVGFDFFNENEDITISNVKVALSDNEVNYRKTNINNFVYYGKEGEFTAKRLTTSMDTTGEVFGFTTSEQINAGMFSNGKSHNYEAAAQITGVTAKEGAYEYGYYAWYKDVYNNVLLKTDGAKFYMTVTVNGEVTASTQADCAAGEGDEFTFVKRSTSDGKTHLSATLKEVTLELSDVDGIFENYYVGVYAKNVSVSFKGIATTSFYVAYDFTEMEAGEDNEPWITSGASLEAWVVEDVEYPVVTLTDPYGGNTITGLSVAVTTKVVNDPVATYEITFNVQSDGNTAYGIVPYYNGDGDYVVAGVEVINGVYSLFVRSSHGANVTEQITAEAGNTVKVVRNGAEFTVSVGEASLTATLDGTTEISEYYGFFAAGNGTATVTAIEFDGFVSFKHYEENGWIKASVEKDDIKFLDNGVITIDGNYTEAGLTATNEQQLAKVIRAEDYTNDYVIEVDLTKIAEPDGQCQRIGIVVWYLNEDNYFVIFVDQWTVWEAYQLNACGIYNGERMTDSSFNEYEWFLGYLDSPGYINQTFNLKVIKNGQKIEGYINNTKIFNKTFDAKYDFTVYEDDTLYLGMFSAGVEAKFENYGVRAMTAEEGTPTPSAGNRPTPPDSGDSGDGDSSSGEPVTPPASSTEPTDSTEPAKGGCKNAMGAGMGLISAAFLAAAIKLKAKKKN